jgi:hypothetical protein
MENQMAQITIMEGATVRNILAALAWYRDCFHEDVELEEMASLNLTVVPEQTEEGTNAPHFAVAYSEGFTEYLFWHAGKVTTSEGAPHGIFWALWPDDEKDWASCPTCNSLQEVVNYHYGPGYCTPMSVVALKCGHQIMEGDYLED